MDGCTVVVVSILLEIAESWCTHLHFGMKRTGARVLCLLWCAHSFAFHWSLYLGVFFLYKRRAWVHGSVGGCIALDFRTRWMGAQLLCLV